MSLNGLDSPQVQQAYQAALAEPGGWILLKYASRDEVDLYGSGIAGPSEARAALAQYEDLSPLYGMVVYRRRKVLVKYVPEGTSRLLQARTTVHLSDVQDKFAPYDTMLELLTADDLNDTTLAAAFPLHTASPLLPSNNQLNEITEDNDEDEEDDDDVPNELTTTASIASASLRRPSSQRSYRSLRKPSYTSEQSPVLKNKSSLSRFFVREELGHSYSSVTALDEYPPSEDTASIKDDAASITSSRTATAASTAPSIRSHNNDSADYDLETYLDSFFKPKVKLGPRPVKVGEKGKRATASVPVSSLPPGIHARSKPPQAQAQPQSQDRGQNQPRPTSSRSQTSASAPASVSNAPPRLPSLHFSPHMPDVPDFLPPPRPNSRGSSRSLPASRSTKSLMTPEKQRLLKALELRKKQMRNSQPAEQAPPVPALPEVPEVTTPTAALFFQPTVQDMAADKADSGIDMADTFDSEETSVISTQNSTPTVEDISPKQIQAPFNTSQAFNTSQVPSLDSPRLSGVREEPLLDRRSSIPMPHVLSTYLANKGKLKAESTKPVDEPQIDTEVLEPEKQNDQENVAYTSEPQIEKKNEEEIYTPESKIEKQNDQENFAHTSEPPTDTRDVGIEEQNNEDTVVQIHEPEIDTGAMENEGQNDQENVAQTHETQEEEIKDLENKKENGPVVDQQQQSTSGQAAIVAESNDPPPSEDLQAKRRGDSEPLHVDVRLERHTSEYKFLSDDDFMDELQTATFEEARPIALSKSPASSFFPKRTSVRSTKSTRSGITAVSADSPVPCVPSINATMEKHTVAPEVLVSSPDAQEPVQSRPLSVCSARTVDSERGDPMLVVRKSGVSSGISQRIQALTASSRDGSPPLSTLSQRKSSSIDYSDKHSIGGAERKPIGRISMWPSNASSQTIKNEKQGNRDSVSVTARIVRVPRHGEGETNASTDLHASPLVYNHSRTAQNGNYTPLAPLVTNNLPTPTDNGRRESQDGVTSPTSLGSVDSGGTGTRRSVDRKSFRSFGPAKHSTTMPSVIETSPDKASRTSRFFKRISHLGKDKRKDAPQIPTIITEDEPTSPVKVAAPAQEETVKPTTTSPPSRRNLAPVQAPSKARPESIADVPPPTAIGDLNVQFPDTMLWKRRWVEINSAGYIMFTAARNSNFNKTFNSKFHMKELSAPFIPDFERQEMPHSVLFDVLEGEGSLQFASEDSMSQRQLLSLLNTYHQAWVNV